MNPGLYPSWCTAFALITTAAGCFSVPASPGLIEAETADSETLLTDLPLADLVFELETGQEEDQAPEISGPDGTCLADDVFVEEGKVHPSNACEVCGPTGAWLACPFGCEQERCTVPQQLVAGDGFSCVATDNHEVWCWGERYVLGDFPPSTQTSYLPRRITIPDTPPLKPRGGLIAGRRHACALTQEGVLWCWGHNVHNAIASTEPGVVENPARAGGNRTFTRVAAGYDTTCGIDESGAIWCWGQTLDGRSEHDWLSGAEGTNGPTQVLGLEATEIAVGHFWACAALLTEPLALACWGHGNGGILGAAMESSADPVLLDWVGPTPSVAVSLTAGPESAFLTIARSETLLEVHAWGANDQTQLGFGPPPLVVDGPKPLGVTPGHQTGYVAAGLAQACRVNATGGVACWGEGAACAEAPALRDRSRAVAVGYDHACSIGEAGFVECWGAHDRQQLGTPSNQAQWCAPPGIVTVAPFQ